MVKVIGVWLVTGFSSRETRQQACRRNESQISIYHFQACWDAASFSQLAALGSASSPARLGRAGG